MQLHAAQPCHSVNRLAVGGLGLLGRPDTRPAHSTVCLGCGPAAPRASGRLTAHIGQVLYFVVPMIKCHSDSTGPLACTGSLRSKLSESPAEPGSQSHNELMPALRALEAAVPTGLSGPSSGSTGSCQ
jgi:hypothetical protein